jgi:hypothetical protein
MRLVSRVPSWRGRQTALLDRSAVAPESPSGPVVRRVRSVVALAHSRLPRAWLLAAQAHPLLRAAWHCPVLQERSVAVLRARELQRACSQPEAAWKHLPEPVYRCRGRE